MAMVNNTWGVLGVRELKQLLSLRGAGQQQSSHAGILAPIQEASIGLGLVWVLELMGQFIHQAGDAFRRGQRKKCIYMHLQCMHLHSVLAEAVQHWILICQGEVLRK